MQAELWTWTYCPFCVRAKDLLERRGVEFTEHVMDGKDAELDAVKAKYGHPSVPIILIDGEFIGGCNELIALDRAGGLSAA